MPSRAKTYCRWHFYDRQLRTLAKMVARADAGKARPMTVAQFDAEMSWFQNELSYDEFLGKPIRVLRHHKQDGQM